ARGVEMLPVALLSNLLSVALAAPLAHDAFGLSARHLLIAAVFGFCAMALGLMLYVIGSRSIPAALSAIIGTLEAPFGAVWAWAGVGEVPGPATLLGGTIVLASVFGDLLLLA